MKNRLKLLTSVAAVTAAIGRQRLQSITRRRTNNIGNWKMSGRFPPDTFLIVSDELEKIGCRAPPSLWGIREPAARAPMRRAS